MTIEKLAERVTYNNQNYAKGDWRSRHGYEAGFIAGASLAVEFAEWLGLNDAVLYENGWLYGLEDTNQEFKTVDKMFELFLTEKYGK